MEETKKTRRILEKEQSEFNRIWHAYHAKYQLPYSYDERDEIFNEIAFIFLKEKE